MKNFIKFAGATLLTVATCSLTSAQERDNNYGRNPNSVRPIDDSNIMWKTRLWRRMDLKEKQNSPFFSKNNEITKYIIEWVQSGVLQAYKNDSLTSKLTKEQFLKNLEMEGEFNANALSEEEKKAGFGGGANDKSSSDDGWGGGGASKDKKPAAGGSDDGWGGTTKTATKPDGFSNTPSPTADAYYYFAKDIDVLEIREDAIFDRQRSRLYFDIQAITILIPAAKTKQGFDKIIGSFRYKDLDKLFRSNPNCIYYNAQNEAQHKNMADAFDLRLFHARLVKKGNAEDKLLQDIYGGEKQGLMMSQQLEYMLLEKEHNLWEY